MALIRDCEAIVRLARSLFRKVRIRIINQLSANYTIICDQLYIHGELLALVAEELVSHLSPPHDYTRITNIVRKLVEIANNMAESAMEACQEGQHRKWFAVCIEHLDNQLVPILERNPIR